MWFLLASACTPDPADRRPPPRDPPPLGLPRITRPADPDVGPVRFWTLALDRPAAVTLTVTGGGESWTLTSPAADQHQVPLLGLLPETRYTVTATAGRRPLKPVGFTTEAPPHPWFWPDIDVLLTDPDRAEPGWTLLPVSAYVADGGVLLILDEQLRVRWWWVTEDRKFQDAVPDGAGGLWVRANPGIEHVTFAGDRLVRFSPDPGDGDRPLDAGPIDHEVLPDGAGGFWTFAHQPFAQPVPVDYGAADLVDAVVDDTPLVHLDPDGHVVRSLPIAPLLDPAHAGFDALEDVGGGERDFVHANGAVPLDDGGAIVSLRDQDVILRLDPAGAIRWMLGDPTGWSAPWQDRFLRPIGEVSWAYHAHGPQWLADQGLLLVFDNHEWGGTPYVPAPPGPVTSRAVAYRIDEDARTVALAWQDDLTSTGPLYSAVMGEVDQLPITGNRLAVYGFVRRADPTWGDTSARVVELVPGEPGRPALDLQLHVDHDLGPDGIWLYRAERGLPPLHP